MPEIRNMDINEIKEKLEDSYKDIKPSDNAPSIKECDVFWKHIFSDSNKLKEVNETSEDIQNDFGENMHEELTQQEKEKIETETDWSMETIEYINTWEEYEIYKKAGLIEIEINGKKCLIRGDIDWNRKYETGKYDEDGNPIFETNQERIAKGRAPLDNDGNPIQLHHIGQHSDSPLAELTFEEHRCNGNDTILHDKTKETETHGEGNTWNLERRDYWKARSEYNKGGNENVPDY